MDSVSNNKITPGVIFNNHFIYDWHIGTGDYSDYAKRDEAVTKEENILPDHDSYSVLNDPKILDDQSKSIHESLKSEYDYFNYMRNKEKSDGLFDATRDKLTTDEINQFREYEKISKKEGCPKYIGIASFDNDFLRENNLIIGDQINIPAIKNAARKGMNALINKSDKLIASNCYWTAAIHTNTDNVHIHYQLLEYHRLENRCKTRKDKDMIERSAMESLISVMATSLNANDLTKNLTEYERNILMKQVKYNFSNSLAKIEELTEKLPNNRGWQYNRLDKSTQNQIDNCIRSIISENAELTQQYKNYLTKIEAVQNNSKRRYGEGSHYTDYKETRLHGKDGFYSRVGNSFLKICKDYQLDKNQREAELMEAGAYLSKKEADVPHADDEYYAENVPYLSEKEVDIEYSYSEADVPPADDEYYAENVPYLSEKEVDIEYSYSEADVPPVDDEYYAENVPYLSEKETSNDCYIKWSKDYKEAARLVYKKDSSAEDIKRAAVLYKSEAAKGNLLAVFDLGKLYASDLLQRKDDELSAKYYKQALDGFLKIEPTAGDMTAYIQYRIGKMYCYGLGTEKNLKQAFDWFSKSAVKGNKFAQFSLANMYYYGNGVEKDLSEAFRWYSNADKQGQPYAAYAIAQMYSNGEGVAADKDLAHIYYQKALNGFLDLENKDRADDNLFYKIGMMYKNGLGTEKDIAKAVDYFKRSALMDNKNGLYEYGKTLISSDYEKRDVEKGSSYLRKAIEYGNINAKRFYAMQYISGENIDQDIDTGLKMLHEEADKNEAADTHSALCLGRLYFKNDYGIPLDIDKAEYYAIRAEKGGNEAAWYLLGKIYSDSNSNKYDIEKAITYFKKSAKCGDPNAQYQLGKIYLSADDKRTAYQYFKQSAENGNTFAAYYAGRILLDNNASADIKTGIEFLQQAALDNFDPAFFFLGRYYSKFDDTDSRSKAKYYLEKSATEHNNSNSQYLLGKVYLSENKTDRAMEYFKMSAERGNQNGQIAYALMLYKQGQRMAATLWIKNAADNGNKTAKKIMRQFDKQRTYAVVRSANIAQTVISKGISQSSVLKRTNNMLRSTLKSEEARTARLMREFEKDQEKQKIQNNSSVSL